MKSIIISIKKNQNNKSEKMMKKEKIKTEKGRNIRKKESR